MVVSVLVVYPCDCVTDWELWLTAAQHHERVSYHLLLAWEKNENSEFKVWFLLNVYCFCTILKLKIHKLNHGKSRTICLSIYLYPQTYIYIKQWYNTWHVFSLL